jgi:hypothetical protein
MAGGKGARRWRFVAQDCTAETGRKEASFIPKEGNDIFRFYLTWQPEREIATESPESEGNKQLRHGFAVPRNSN